MSDMNNQYKLLITDIDGTIANRLGEISEVDLAALLDVHRRGVKISLCTGRPACGCKKYLDRLSLDGFHIFAEGALVIDSELKNVIFRRTIDKGLLLQLCELAASQGLPLELFSEKAFFVRENHPMVNIHAQLMDIQPQLADLKVICAQEEIILACIVVPLSEEKGTMELLNPISHKLSLKSTVNPVFPYVRFINLTEANVSKGTAVTTLINYLGLRQEEVVAMGDAYNDMPLFEAAGYKVAMANAPDRLKNKADLITSDVEHNGVAEAIGRIFG